jgi:uncharacterized membrane protein YeaQ/YmgE (transglycosylase-associated protein family)
MGLLLYLIILLLSGLVVGAFARLALPGRDPMSIPATIAVGIAGSLIAGIITYAIWGEGTGGGLLLSIACAAAIVYVIRRSRGGGLMDPGTPGGRRRRW